MTRSLVLALVTVLWSGCASRSDGPAPIEPAVRPDPPGPAPVEAEPSGHKPRAPVALTLTASGSRDALTLTLEVRATADLPRATSRFTLPAGVELVSGALEQELGPQATGQVSRVSVVVRAPATGRPIVFGGVDCHLSHGVKLYGVTELALEPSGVGPDVRGPARLIDGAAARATPARPRR